MSRLRTADIKAGALRRKEAVHEALKRSLDECTDLDGRPVDRETIAVELSRLVGEHISVHTLNGWCGESKENRMLPLERAEALAIITNDRRILEAAMSRYRVIDEKGVAFLEIGMFVVDERERNKRKRQLFERAKP